MTQREDVLLPLWKSDEADRETGPHFEAPYFDTKLHAWVVSRYEDVLTAFRSSHLIMDSKKPAGEDEISASRKIREETLAALSPAQLQAWSEEMAPAVRQRLEALKEGGVSDLLKDYLHPICLHLAAMATAIDAELAARLQEMAWAISAAAAEPLDGALRAKAKAVTPRFREHFHSEVETLRDSGFVALACTLPGLLGNAYYALLREPEQWSLLHARPELIEQALEELMRYAGLARTVRRQAGEDVLVGGETIRRGESLILRVMAANRDPDRFSDAHRLDVCRREGGHLSLGAGVHARSGAGLIRTAGVAMTRPLIASFATATLTGPVGWRGGSGFRTPTGLPVVLQRV